MMHILSTEEWNQLCKEMAAERDKKPVCCCSAPFVIDGVQYTSRNSGCHIHGLRSRYVAQPGNTLREKHTDGKRHCAVNERE
jgi:hypothetical protein